MRICHRRRQTVWSSRGEGWGCRPFSLSAARSASTGRASQALLFRPSTYFPSATFFRARRFQVDAFPAAASADRVQFLHHIAFRQKPNVYFMILDAYGRADTLKLGLGFDNEGFLGELKKLGFFVPRQSVSNYPATNACVGSMRASRWARACRRRWHRPQVFRVCGDPVLAPQRQAAYLGASLSRAASPRSLTPWTSRQKNQFRKPRANRS